ncbi:hypothetical protein DB32_002458 [Sandaracinus amylolyticus]|uniref:Peptidase M50 domain-containing protein n=1 Tax=Sandaracinus amylolyticus TaxID=927083 RepID=A0A0F6SEJ6_9BACT|nr:hypothetical protein DB32_002458 [Sandaracinus amylolyticus]
MQWIAPHLVVTARQLPTPVRLHWSLLPGLAFFGHGTLGGALGFFVLLLAHELGHAFLVRKRGLYAVSIDLHWMGGECRYAAGWGTPLDHAIIAWGGVVAQGLLLAATFALVRVLEPHGGFVGDLARALLVSNLLLIVLNLVPVPPLDGAKAWSLFPLLLARRRRRVLELRHDALHRELAAIERRKARARDEDEDDDDGILH